MAKAPSAVSGTAKRPLKEPFCEEKWGGSARNWARTAGRLTDSDWEEIMADVNERVRKQGGVGLSDDGLNSDGMSLGAAEGSGGDPRMSIEL